MLRGVIRRRRWSVAAAVVAVLALVSVPVAGNAAARPRTVVSVQAAPAMFRVLQLNMCMWGYYAYRNQAHHEECFPDPDDNAEQQEAARKRQSVIDQVKRLRPDAVTVNEGCKGDIADIVAALRQQGLDYAFKSVELGRGSNDQPRQCSVGRGDEVNAVIAPSFLSGSWTGGYFEHPGYRAWMCAVTQGVRVCTAHLSLSRQDWGGRKHQPIECNALRARLRQTGGYPTVFAGDTNLKHDRDNCMPTAFFGLQDFEVGQDENTPGTGGLQHIYYSNDITRGDTCGHVPHVDKSDHNGFWIDLQPTSTPARGNPCNWRAVRPAGWAPSEKWLHGYRFHQEAHSRWTGPSATRLALTMQAQYPWQQDLAEQLGTTSANGTPSITDVTRVLNDSIAADGGPRYYETKAQPTVSLLKSDMKYDFVRGFAIVARVKGHATDTTGGGHYAKYGRYIDVVGYYKGGDRLTVEDTLKPRDDVEHRRYNMTTAAFVDWIYQGYSA